MRPQIAARYRHRRFIQPDEPLQAFEIGGIFHGYASFAKAHVSLGMKAERASRDNVNLGYITAVRIPEHETLAMTCTRGMRFDPVPQPSWPTS
jgi:hypothetical protein